MRVTFRRFSISLPMAPSSFGSSLSPPLGARIAGEGCPLMSFPPRLYGSTAGDAKRNPADTPSAAEEAKRNLRLAISARSVLHVLGTHAADGIPR